GRGVAPPDRLSASILDHRGEGAGRPRSPLLLARRLPEHRPPPDQGVIVYARAGPAPIAATAAAAAALALCAFPCAGAAEPNRRYAVIIGNNSGRADEP